MARAKEAVAEKWAVWDLLAALFILAVECWLVHVYVQAALG